MLPQYMKEARRLRSTYGRHLRTIYLATDSDAVVADALANYSSEWTFLYQSFNRTHFAGVCHDKGLDRCHLAGDADVVDDHVHALVDARLLGDADAYVSAFSSNIGRLGYELAVGRRRCYPPFVSVDIAWCHNGGRAMGGHTEWKHTAC